MGERRNVYRLLVGKPEGRRPLGRPRRRWVDNVTMDLVEVGCGDVDWIGLAQDKDKVESSCEFGIEPSGSIKCWETIECPNKLGISRVVFSSMELGWGDEDWIDQAQDKDKVDSSCELVIEPSCSIKYWETIECPNKPKISRVVLSSMELGWGDED
jgi:hypothetical protein